MGSSFRVGSIAGIDIYINPSWFIVIVFLTISLAIGWFPSLVPGYTTAAYVFLGLLASLLLFVSVLLHELAHSLVARARGLPVKSIVLFIFGGVSNIEQEPERPGVEFQMAFVGPLVSLLIGGLAFLVLYLLGGSRSPLGAVFTYLAASNVLLGIFNLIPGFPLDGGRVLRSIIWKITGDFRRATRIATIVGEVIAYLLIMGGILLFFTGNTFSGIWIGFTGWFLLSAAQSSNAQVAFDTAFRGVVVSQVMDTHVETAPANISVQRLVDEYFLPHALHSAFVMQGERFAGIITLNEVRHIVREEWSKTVVGLVMTPVERFQVAKPQQPIGDALKLMVAQKMNELPVVEDGQLVGVLSREGIVHYIEVRRSLNVKSVA